VTIVLPFFCQFNYVYALNYPLRLERARLTQKRARTARAAVGPDPSLACPRPRFEARKRPFCPSSTVAARLPGSDDRRKPRPGPLRERVDLIGLGRAALLRCGWAKGEVTSSSSSSTTSPPPRHPTATASTFHATVAPSTERLRRRRWGRKTLHS